MKKLLTILTFMSIILAISASACGDKERVVLISTEYGDIKAKLYNETPKHRDNFLKLAEEKFYDGLLFHRVIKGFMLQGGDPESRNAAPGQMLGGGGPGYTIPAEFNPQFFHKKGALCAARQGDQVNPEKESSGSQFYIVHGKPLNDEQLEMMEERLNTKYTPEQKEGYKAVGGAPFLDNNYTIFGEVIEGLEVVDKLAAIQTAPGDRPLTDVKMTVKVLK